MTTEIDLFHFDDGRLGFEDFAKDNGFRYWYARDFMRMLGYEHYKSFSRAINKALAACATLNINISQNFTQEKREVDGETVDDYRLSRFACYLTAMNGDIKKPEVAAAQAYFATLTEAFRRYAQETEDVERIITRDEISDSEKTLSSTANAAGIENYQFFQNAGYRGMYNMNLGKLKLRKGVSSGRSLLDFMGKDELAANLFRLTQTEARIKKDNVRGQRNLENAANTVGKKVRTTMIELSGQRPEDLRTAEDVRRVRSDLKKTQKQLSKMDRPRQPANQP